MKKMIWIGSLLLLFSCSDFLTVNDPTQIDNDEVLNNLDNAELATVGLYNYMVTEQSMYDEFIYLYPELMAGNITPNPDLALTVNEINRYVNLYQFNAREDDDGLIGSLYGSYYELIMAASNIIEAVPLIEDDRTDLKNALIAEASAIRALAYFFLLQWYGQDVAYSNGANHPGVPIISERSDLFATRARNTVAEVYLLIESDLRRSVDLWNTSAIRSANSRFWLNEDAIWGLLSRVYLYQGRYEQAIAAADSCLQNTNLSLLPSDQLLSDWGNQQLSETLWTLSADFALSTGINSLYGSNITNEEQEFVISADLRSIFESDDVRLSDLMIRNTLGLWSTAKYPFAVNQKALKPIIRLSEVYLNRAEANIQLGETAEARADIERIILQSGSWTELSNIANEDLWSFLQLERRRELAFEGHAFLDLRRWQQSVERNDYPDELMNADMAYPSDFFVLPLPQSALIQNPSLMQNPSY